MLKEEIEKIIRQFVSDYEKRDDILSGWEEPVIAYADAEDVEFRKLKNTVGPSHLLPEDFLNSAKTVITYFLPFKNFIAESNIEEKDASRTWAIAYIETNNLIYEINNYVKEKLEKSGYTITIIPATHNFDEKNLISDWSHRHVAYIAGLGKFGLNNMLITEKGCCGRIGSIVTDLDIEPSKRNTHEYCLYKVDESCTQCVDRCVNNALFTDRFHRQKCYEMCLYNNSLYPDIGLCDVCGKCMVGVPCSFTNPNK